MFAPASPGHPHRRVHTSRSLARDPGRGTLGALRLKVRLTEDRILPSRCYQPLTELLMGSVLGPAEVGASILPGIRMMASPSRGSSAGGPRALGHLPCLLSLPRRMLLAPWLCWRS